MSRKTIGSVAAVGFSLWVILAWIQGSSGDQQENVEVPTVNSPRLVEGPRSADGTLAEVVEGLADSIGDRRTLADQAVIEGSGLSVGQVGSTAVWRGQVRLFDDSGEESAPSGGILKLKVSEAAGYQEVEVQVLDGEFSIDPVVLELEEEFVSLTVLHGFLDGRFAYEPTGLSYPMGEGSAPRIRMEGFAPLVLDVREWGTETRLELVHVLLHNEREVYDGDLAHPGADVEPWLTSSTRPHVVPIERLTRVDRQFGRVGLFVGAPGFAWTFVPVDLREQSSRPVDLRPGGSLEVSVVGVPPGDELKLSLMTDQGYEGVNFPFARKIYSGDLEADGLYRFDGLITGNLYAKIHRGEWFGTGAAFAEGRVRVASGGRHQLDLTLDVAVSVPPSKRSVELLLEFPEAWGAKACSGDLRLNGAKGVDGSRVDFNAALEESGGSSSVFRTETLELREGRWLMTAQEGACAVPFDVARDGEHRILVPGPVDTQVRLVDAHAGVALDGVDFRWKTAVEDFRGASTRRGSPVPGQAGCFQLRTTRSRLELWLSGPGYGQSLRYLDPSELGGVVELGLDRVQGVRLSLFAAEDVPFLGPEAWRIQLRTGSADGGDATTSRSGTLNSSLRTIELSVPQAGAYTLWYPKFDGFETPEPEELFLEDGVVIEREVVLVKTP